MAELMPMPVLLVLLLVALSGLPTWGAAAVPAYHGDAAAMHALANWTSADSSLGWGIKSPNPCDGTWSGVSCNDAGRVTSIVASRAGLAGVLHGSDLASLSFLAELDLGFNSLTTPTGYLPLIPTPLQHLRSLNLRSNRFIGIPEGFFAAFPALETITLDDNPMASPEFLLDVLTCSRLRSLSANNIGYLHNFPDFFGNTLVFPALETLSLARNEISGTIPPSFGNNSNIKYLDVSNQIHDSQGYPSLLGRIDQFIPGMKSLVEVRMDDNGFFGPLPDATELVNLRVFSATDNNLCGVPKFPGSASVNLTGNPHVGVPC